jgi:uncharacterized protein
MALVDLLPWLGLVLLGFAVGTFGTLVGAGGGFLLVPLLLLLYPVEPVATITAMSLAVVFLNATSGSIAYARLRRIDYRTGLVFAAASAPGAILGARATSLLPRGIFDAAFGLALIGLAAYLLLRGRVTEGHTAPAQVNLRLGALLSFGVGFFSSVLGIGGGVIHVPLLIQFLGYPAHIATATSHFILAIMSLIGTLTHVVDGEFASGVRRTLALGAGVLVGAQVGAQLSRRVHGTLILRALAVGILLVGARLSATVVLADPTAFQPLARLGEQLALGEGQVVTSRPMSPNVDSVVAVVAYLIGSLVIGGAVILLARPGTRRHGRAAIALGLLASGCTSDPPTAPLTVAPVSTTVLSAPPRDLDTAETEFGNLIRLEAAHLSETDVRAGNTVILELTWQLLRPTERDLGAVVRLVDASGRTVARRDTTIGSPAAGTGRWPARSGRTEAVELLIPDAVAPGHYDLAISVTDPVSSVQIPVSAEAGLPPVLVTSQQIVGVVRVTSDAN